MRIIKNSCLQLLCVIFLFSTVCFAQDSAKVIILSERIGHIIDAEEMNYYGILPSFKDKFVNAIYYLSADSQYCCLVNFDTGKTVKDTIIILSYTSIKNTAFRVQNFENTQKGKIEFSYEDTRLKFLNGSEVKKIFNMRRDISVISKDSTQKNKIIRGDNQEIKNNNNSGCVIEITKKNGELIKGNFNCINNNPLRLLVNHNYDGIIGERNILQEIELSEIEKIVIVKKSKMLTSMGNGFLIGAGVGAIIGGASGDDETGIIKFSAETKALGGGIVLGLAGAIIGAAVGSGQSEDEEIKISSLNNLKYLEKYAKHQNHYEVIQNPKQKNTSYIDENPIEDLELTFKKKFEISIFFSTTSSGPAVGIQDQMRMFDFNNTSYNSWFNAGYITYPKSYTGLGQLGTPWLTTLKYYYKEEWLFGAFYGENPIGWTTGYNENNDYLDIYYSVNTIAAMTWYKYYNFSLGLGPAMFLTNSYENELITSEHYRKTKIGFVAEVGITYPAHSTFFVCVITQFRFVGNVNIGPFMVGDNSTLPSFNINYNHFCIGFGAGIRL